VLVAVIMKKIGSDTAMSASDVSIMDAGANRDGVSPERRWRASA
jgi:hypothetical protein